MIQTAPRHSSCEVARIWGRIAVVLVTTTLLLSCNSPRPALMAGDDSVYRATEFRASHASFGEISLRAFRDRRPQVELGHVNYLNESWYSESILRGSVASNLKRVLLGELISAGVFGPAIKGKDSSHELDITLFHFYCKADRDLLGLIPVIPSIQLTAEIDMHILLRDTDGRRFIDRRFRGRRESNTATIAGIESSATDLLLELLSEIMDEFVRETDQLVPEFWAQFGMVPPTADRPLPKL